MVAETAVVPYIVLTCEESVVYYLNGGEHYLAYSERNIPTTRTGFLEVPCLYPRFFVPDFYHSCLARPNMVPSSISLTLCFDNVNQAQDKE